MRRHLIAIALLAAAPAGTLPAPAQTRFEVHEATIADIHAAIAGRRLTCRALVEAYLARIAAFDRNGPAINALVVLNGDALAQADALDRRFERDGLTGPLH